MKLPDNPRIYLETRRLYLRAYKSSDREFMREMQCDPEWMKNFSFTRTPAQADALIDKFQAEIEKEGFSFFALETRKEGAFAGYTGLHVPEWKPPCGPCVEIGWGIRKRFQGRGFASEAAKACLDYARDRLHLKEVFAFTTPGNTKSLAVMERIGMKRVEGGDFLHPKIDPKSRFAKHLLYRIRF